MGQPFPQDVVAGGQIIIPQIYSPNFSISGKTGWAVLQNGDAYFYNLTAEGEITTNMVVVTGSGQGVFVYNGTLPVVPAIVQSKTIADATSGSFTNPTTAGNCVVAVINALGSTSGDVPSVSAVTLGGAEGNFAQAVSAVSAFSPDYNLSAIWADPDCAGGQTAVAVTGSNITNNANYGITILEVSGLATSSVVDQTSSDNGDSESWTSGTTAETTVAEELWVGANTQSGAGTQPGSPWTTFEYTSGFAIGGGYQVVSSNGTATYAGSQASSQAWAAAVATLAGAGGSTPALVASIASEAGTDQYGNAYLAGMTSYLAGSQAIQMNGSTLSFYFGPAAGPYTEKSQMALNGSGGLDVGFGGSAGEWPQSPPSFTSLGSTWNSTTASECNANFLAITTLLANLGLT